MRSISRIRSFKSSILSLPKPRFQGADRIDVVCNFYDVEIEISVWYFTQKAEKRLFFYKVVNTNNGNKSKIFVHKKKIYIAL